MRTRPYLGSVIGILLVMYLATGLICGSRAAINAYEATESFSMDMYWNRFKEEYVSRKTPTPEPKRNATRAFLCGLADPFHITTMVGGRAWAWMEVLTGNWRPYPDQPFWWVSLGPTGYSQFFNFTGMRPNGPSRGLIFIWVVTVAMPLVFLILPVTRKRAKVRGGHILRLFLLSLMVPFASWLLYCVAWGSELGLYLGRYSTVVYAFGVIIPFVLLLIFWKWGCRDFLRLSLWPAVYFSIVLIGFLLGMVSMVITEYGFRYFSHLF